jgi:8-oxo-dGTP diphosphatase
MNNEPRVAGLIIRDQKILLIHRYKKGWGEYYVLPGGTIEDTETPEQTLVREIQEETCYDLMVVRKLLEFDNTAVKRHEFYFLMTEPVGEAKFAGPELDVMGPDNQYELVWVELTGLGAINLQPKEIKELILTQFA